MSRIKDLAKKNALRIKRKKRVRANIFGTAEKPRVSIFKSNKYIQDYLKSVPKDKQNSLLENILIIGIDFIKKIYDSSEIYKKVKTIASFPFQNDLKYLFLY